MFLDISAEDAAKRGGYGTEKYERKDVQDRVRELFRELRSRKEGEDFVVVDAGGSLEEVQSRILETVRRCMSAIETEQGSLRTVGEW